MIYNCGAYPPGGGTKFIDNVLVDKRGDTMRDLDWVPEVRHNECAQAVTQDRGAVTLEYASSNEMN